MLLLGLQENWFCSVVVITPDFDPTPLFRQPQFESGQDLAELVFNNIFLIFSFLFFVFRFILCTFLAI